MPPRDIPARTIAPALILLLLARLVLGVVYSALIPLAEAPDEADHYAYVSYLVQEGRLPEGTFVTQGKHPPLYYVLAALAASPTGADLTFLRSNPDVSLAPGASAPNFFVHTTLESWPWRGGALAMHLARLVSVLAGVTLVAATYALGGTIWPQRKGMALAAAIFVAFLPEALFVGGAVSNDMLAATLSALALWAALRGPSLRAAALAGGFLGLAMLSKASSVSLAPVVAGAIGLRHGRLSPSRQAVARVVIAGMVALLIVSPWLWRNWHLYGDPMGWPVVLGTIDQRNAPLGWRDLLALGRGWFYSFWGKFGGAGHVALPMPFYGVWLALLALGAGGWLRRLVASRGRVVPVSASWAAHLVLWGAPLLVTVSIISYSRVALGTDQGRLLFPALAPLGLLLVEGISAWAPRLRPQVIAGGMAGLMVPLALLALVTGIVLPFSPPPVPAGPELTSGTPSGQMFGEQMQLVAWGWHAGTGSENCSTQLTLYWQARQAPDEDLRAVLRLTDREGNLIREWKRSPGAGAFQHRSLAGRSAGGRPLPDPI
jgi:hypothetical protein